MSEKLIKIYDTLYVGVKKASDEYQPGFMTYFDNDDSAFKKRKATIDHWSCTGRQEYIDNDPLEGFKILDFESRYSTDNKVFDVQDPRGFILQLYAEDLIMLIKSAVIEFGLIQGKCVWGRNGVNNCLIPVDSTIYEDAIELKESDVTISDLVPGNIVTTSSNNKMIYIGKKYVIGCRAHQYWNKIPPSRQNRFSSAANEPIDDYEYTYHEDHLHCFLSEDEYKKMITGIGIQPHTDHTFYVSVYKSLKIAKVEKEIKSIPKTVILDSWFKLYNSYKKLDGGHVVCPHTAMNCGVQNLRIKLFDDKASANNFDSSQMRLYMEHHINKAKESKEKDETPRYYFW